MLRVMGSTGEFRQADEGTSGNEISRRTNSEWGLHAGQAGLACPGSQHYTTTALILSVSTHKCFREAPI